MPVSTTTSIRLIEPYESALRDELAPTAGALVGVLTDFLHRDLPHRRIARLAGLLHLAGVTLDAELRRATAAYLCARQQNDGGWVDCEDSAWCSHVVDVFQGGTSGGRSWLTSERSGAAWGYCRRDEPCIPITASVRLLVPALADSESAAWLREAWSRDLGGQYRLSYKAAWYLLASGRHHDEAGLIDQTIGHLMADQRPDGGWGPWRDHAAPTDCLSTGLVMWALAMHSSTARVGGSLERAVEFCLRARLDNGLFPVHYIEEGSAWLLLGWTAALHLLAK